MRGQRRVRLLIASWVMAVPLTLGLVGWLEPRVEPEATILEDDFVSSSPLQSMTFTRALRVRNIQEMGFGDDVLLDAVRRAADRLDGRRDALREALLEHEEIVAAAFCPASIPVPYRAAAVMLRGGEGSTQLVRPLSQGGGFGRSWELADDQLITDLFRRWEYHESRKPGDSAIAIAALVGGHVVQAVQGREDPFRRRFSEGGRVEVVFEVFPGLEQQTIAYAAHVIVIAEMVQGAIDAFGCRGAGRNTP